MPAHHSHHKAHALSVDSTAEPKPNKFLRLPEVTSRTGLSRSTLYTRMAGQVFPSSVSIGPRSVAWLESEVDEWIANRLSQRRLPKHRI